LRFVSPALKHIVFPTLSRIGYLRYAAGAGPTVVTYHGVFPAGYKVTTALDGNLIHADSLRRQLKLLTKRYQVITPEDFLRWSEEKLSLPPRSILLTCDDALRNTLTEMVPILEEFGVSCLFFVTGASGEETPSMLWYEELYLMLLGANEPISLSLPEAGIGACPIVRNERHAFWWTLVERLSQFDGELRRRFLNEIRGQLELSESWRERFVQDSTLAARFLTLDVAGLRKLAAAGMTIGAHSLSHPILARASAELAWREISESRSVLENILGQTVWAFGYPFGNAATVTARDVQMTEQAGFRCAFMNSGGGFGAKIDRFALPRVHVTADMSLFEFEAHISGFYGSLRKRLLDGYELHAAAGGSTSEEQRDETYSGKVQPSKPDRALSSRFRRRY
jgi:peptidoglycan/xylan/chitin deacetylase (PgdA/CDA1 family)